MRAEIEDKDALIDQLKKNIKLSKTEELEAELQVYIEECARLRQLLEIQFSENKKHQTIEMQEQQNIEDQERIEKAFYEKELQLQQQMEIA